MRTTLTRDDDVNERIRRLQVARGISFEAAVNLLLRAGLDHEHIHVRAHTRYTTPAVSTGAPLVDLSQVGDLEAQEDEARRVRR